MRNFYKSIVSIAVVFVLVINTAGVCNAQEEVLEDGFIENGLEQSEVLEIVEKIEETENNHMEKACSVDEIEEYIEDVDGITRTKVEEVGISIENAVEEVFVENEMSETAQNREITEYDNTRYFTEIYEEENVTYVKTYSEDMLQMSVLSYDGENIQSEHYAYQADTGIYEKQSIGFRCEEENDVYAQAITYSSKTKSAKWKDKTYWYQNGNEKKKTYLKIGCKAIYRIRTDNLSGTKDKKCEKYMNAVKSSKSYEKKALAYASAAGISGAAIIALVLANAAFPPSTIVTIVFGVLGGGATIYNAVNHTVNSFEKWQDARDYYDIIKAYGTKI